MDDVSAKFPSMRDDLVSSSQCFALGQFTASVFHLMRALEPCSSVLSRELGVVKHSPTWNAYLSAFPKAIGAKFSAKTAADKEMIEFYSGVTDRLDAIKDAWRNSTMHDVAKSYDEQQALDVRNSTHSFMRRSAEKLQE